MRECEALIVDFLAGGPREIRECFERLTSEGIDPASAQRALRILIDMGDIVLNTEMRLELP